MGKTSMKSKASAMKVHGKSVMKMMKSAMKKKGVVETEEPSQPQDESPAVSAKVPPALKDWLAGKKKWAGPQSQAVRDYSNALKTKGYAAASAALAHCRGKDAKQELITKLSMLKTDAEMHIFETDTLAQIDKLKTTEGWMSKFEVIDLLKIPWLPEFKNERNDALAQLSQKSDSPQPGGIAYYYSHRHLDTRTVTRTRAAQLKAKKQLQDESDWNASKALMNKDHGKFQPIEDAGVSPGPKAKAKAKPTARGAIEMFATDVPLAAKEKLRAQLLLSKKQPTKTATNTQNGVVKEVGNLAKMESIANNSGSKIGTAQVV